jgi:predicted transcriptional regulator
MKAPCEVIVWDVLPGIRAVLTEELVKRGLPQQEISIILGITPAAVSQYVSKKRGYKIEFQDAVKAEIKRLANDILQRDVDNLCLRICEICMKLRIDRTVCKLDKCGGVDEECNLCRSLISSKV